MRSTQNIINPALAKKVKRSTCLKIVLLLTLVLITLDANSSHPSKADHNTVQEKKSSSFLAVNSTAITTHFPVASVTYFSGTGTSGDADIGDVYLLEDVFEDVNGNFYDLRVEVLDASLDPSGQIAILTSGDVIVAGIAADNNWGRFLYTIVEANSVTLGNPNGTAINFSGNINARDIDSNNGQNFTEVFGVSTTSQVTTTSLYSGSYLETHPTGFIADGPATGSFEFYRLDPASFGSADNWANEPNSSTSAQEHWINYSFVSFSSLDFVAGITGAHTSNQARGTSFDFNFYLIGQDADYDGIADQDDQDTDNDGIPDAEEGFDCENFAIDEMTYPINTDIQNTNHTQSSGVTVSYSSVTFAGNTTTNGGNIPLRSNTLPSSTELIPFIQMSNTGTDINSDYVEYVISFSEPVNVSLVSYDLDYLEGTRYFASNGGTSIAPSEVVLGSNISSIANGGLSTLSSGTSQDDPSVKLEFHYFDELVDEIVVQYFSQISGAHGSLLALEICAPIDSDKDGIPNYLDLDSDNDGIPDLIEAGGIDTNGDGQIDYPTPNDPSSMVDLDGDGLADLYDDTDNGGSTPGWVAGTPINKPDNDGDGIPNYLDLDSDNDGLPDLVELGGIDTNGDGIVDDLTDADGDGYADVFDPDDDGAIGVDTGEEGSPLIETNGVGAFLNGENGTAMDSDGDGISDHLDLDTDNDGIPDLVEAGGIDTNGDGRVDILTDADSDGFADIYDTDDDGTTGIDDAVDALVKTGGTDTDGDGKADDPAITYENGSNQSADTDGDGLPDHLDLDADNDGIPDLVEAGATDPNNDGRVDTATLPWDADGDGLADVYDENASDGPTGTGVNGVALIETSSDTNSDGQVNNGESMQSGGGNTINHDNDGIPNHLDLDADNDGITDVVENAGGDVTADNGGSGNLSGTVNNFTDAGNNGWNDSNNSNVLDTDNDGVPDFLDLDADNDGIPDFIENVCTACPTTGGTGANLADVNNNGVLDFFENMNADNTDNAGGTNVGVSPNLDDDSVNSTPDYLDLDTDDDSAFDWTEGFDINGDGVAFDDIISLAADYETANTNPGNYPNTDTDNDGLPDWLDNQPTVAGYDESIVPPFLDPTNPAWIDGNNDGLVAIFDPAENGTLAPTPNTSGTSDDDWRDNAIGVFLPVDLSYFKGIDIGCDVYLEWESISEVSFNHFELQRSSDGIQFTPLTQFNGQGGTDAKIYIYTDTEPQTKNYYRLKMVDRDGSVEYSKIIFVASNCLDQFQPKIYPNPISRSNDLLNVTIIPDRKILNLQVIAVDGKVVKNYSFDTAKGEKMTLLLDLSGIPEGTYYLKKEGKQWSQPFLIFE